MTLAHWSHSQLDSIFECGERYRLEKVAHAPRLPAWWFVSGTAFHETTELFDRALFKGVEWTEGEMLEAWIGCWQAQLDENRAIEPDESKWQRGGRVTKTNPNKESGEFLFEQGIGWVNSYRTWRLENPHLVPFDLPDGEPAIEVEYTIQIAGQPVKGAIDRVFIDTIAGSLLVVDLKSGARKPQNNNQLAEYGHAFQQLFDAKIEYGAYYMARQGALLDPAPLTFTLEMFEQRVRGAQIMRENKVYVPNLTDYCKACGVSRFCAAYGGADADLYKGVDE